MSSNLVIVALPEEDDYVWKISSEKKPHLTLLFLGESEGVANLEQIMQFVEHAASTSLKRFHLSVDRRGELGEDKADVLFFRKGYDTKAVRDFRSMLLQDSNIKTAYDAAAQFDGPWLPHLTLGYPEAPAKPMPDDSMSRIYGVGFDRIAVWTGDFEGPEFELKDYWDDIEDINLDVPMSVAYGAIEHHGVKGMRWGVRKAEVHPDIADVPVKTRKAASKDAEEFTRAKLYFGEGAGNRRKLIKAKVEQKKKDDELYAKAFDHFVKQTDLAKRAHQAKKQRKRVDRTASAKKAVKSISREVRPLLQQSADTIQEESVGEENGSAQETIDRGREFLEHYGVKGMRWGVRKEEPTAVGAKAASVVPHGDKRKTKIKVEGGQNHEASEDAKRVAEARAKLEKSGTHALSNAELRDVANRLQLEQQVKQLSTPASRKFVSNIVRSEGQNVVRTGVKRSGRVARKAALGF